MQYFAKYFGTICCFLVLSGCLNPRDFETEPVKLETSKGIVTCQLYRQDQVLWDRAIHRPNSMSVAEADAHCIAEGQRRLEG